MRRPILLALALSLASSAFAVPQTLNYQGRLRTNTGVNVPDSTGNTIVFRLFTQATNGSAIWTETWNSATSCVSTTAGLFNVNLGSWNSLSGVPFDQQYWLEVQVNGDPQALSPRTALSAAPYALRSKTIDFPQDNSVNTASPSFKLLNVGSGNVIEGHASNSGAIALFGKNTVAGGRALYSEGSALFTANGAPSSVSFQTHVDFSGATVTGLSVNAPLSLTFSANGIPVIRGYEASAGGGSGVAGQSVNGTGVVGISDFYKGVIGIGNFGPSYGVYGQGNNGATGIWGIGGYGVRGEGMTGTAGVANQAKAIGVLADQNLGSVALKVLGNSEFIGGSVTFSSRVDFSGATVTGLSASVSAPLSLTLGSAALSPLSVSNAAGTAALLYGGTGAIVDASGLGLSITTKSSGQQALYVRSNSAGHGSRFINDGGGAAINAVSGGGSGIFAQSSSAHAVYGQSNGSGVAGIFGLGGNASGYAMLADYNGLGMALKVSGPARFDMGSVSFAAHVDFSGANVTGLTVTVNAPLSLTLNAASFSPLSVFNSSGGVIYAVGGGNDAAIAVSGTAVGVDAWVNAVNGNGVRAGKGAAGGTTVIGGAGLYAYNATKTGVYAEGGSNAGAVGVSATTLGTNGMGGYFYAMTGVVGLGGSVGVIGRGSSASGTGMLADMGLGAMALKVSGPARFDMGSVSFAAHVDFSGANVTGLNVPVVAPLSLTLSSAGAAPLYVSQSGAAAAVSVVASGSGNAIYGRSNFGYAGYFYSANGSSLYSESVGSYAVEANAQSASAVRATAVSGEALWGANSSVTNPAVRGQNSNSGAGVWGESSSGPGVMARTGSSVGLSATATGAAAQAVFGRVSSSGATAEFINDNVSGSPLKLNNLKFPANAGANGQVLTTNGSNQMSWSNAPAPAAPLSLTLSSTSASPLSVSNATGTAGLFNGLTGIAATGVSIGVSATATGGQGVGVYAQGGIGIIASGPGGGGRFFVTQPGSAAVYGNANASNSIGVLADYNNSAGGVALKVSGPAYFDLGSVTFASHVDFSGANVTGLNVPVVAPLSLSTASNSQAALYAYNSNGTAAIVSASAGSSAALAAYNYAVSSPSIGLAGYSSGIAPTRYGVAGSTEASIITGQGPNGVLGYSAANTGVRGVLDGANNSGQGIYGLNNGANNTGFGVRAENQSGSGWALYALNSSATGSAVAISASSSSASGLAGYFSAVTALSAVGGAVALNARAANLSSTEGVVMVNNTANTGFPVGVRAVSNGGSGGGYGVFGIGDHSGVVGQGSTYGVFAQGLSGAQAALYADGTTGPATYAVLAAGNNLGVSATAKGAAGQAFYGRVSSTSAAAEFINDNVAGTPLKINNMKFPPNDIGQTGRFLGTDGAGNLSWQNAGANVPLNLTLGSQTSSPLNVSNSVGIGATYKALTGIAITGANLGISITAAPGGYGLYADYGYIGVLAAGSGYGGRFFGTGPGGAAVFARGDTSTAVGLWAENPYGGQAMVVSGNAQIGYPGGGATTTFLPGNSVNFSGVSVTGLTVGLTAPQVLSGNVTMTGAVLTVSNTGNGIGIVGYATKPGTFVGGLPDMTAPITSGVKGYTNVSNSVGVAGYSDITYTSGIGVMGIGAIAVGGFARTDASGTKAGNFVADGPNGTAIDASAANGVGMRLQGQLIGASISANASGGTGLYVSGTTGIIVQGGFEQLAAQVGYPTSSTGTGRIYFDGPAGKFKVSQNGSPYQDLLGAAGSLSAPASLTSTSLVTAFSAFNASGGYALLGQAGLANSVGVYGKATVANANAIVAEGMDVGVSATASNGSAVVARSNAAIATGAFTNDGNGNAVNATANGTAAALQAFNSSNSFGVYATSNGGTGIFGTSSSSGYGVEANNSGPGGAATAFHASSLVAPAGRGALIEGNSLGASITAASGTALYLGGSVAADFDAMTNYRGLNGAVVSSGSQGRIYYDSGAQKFRYSENGGGYKDFGTASAPINVTSSSVATIYSHNSGGGQALVLSGTPGTSGVALVVNPGTGANSYGILSLANNPTATNRAGLVGSSEVSWNNPMAPTGVHGYTNSGIGVGAIATGSGGKAVVAQALDFGVSATASSASAIGVYTSVNSGGQAVYAINGGGGEAIKAAGAAGNGIVASTQGSMAAGIQFAAVKGTYTTSLAGEGAGLWGIGSNSNVSKNAGVYGEIGSPTFPTLMNGLNAAGAGVAGNNGLTFGIGVVGIASGVSSQGMQAQGGAIGISASANSFYGGGGYFTGLTGVVAVGQGVGVSATATGSGGRAGYFRSNTTGNAVTVINDDTTFGTALVGQANGGGVGVSGQVVNGGINSVGVFGSNTGTAGIGIRADNLTATAAAGGAALMVNGLIKVANFSATTAGTTNLTVTLHQPSGSITLGSGNVQTITLTNSYITPKSVVLISFGTTQGVATAPIVRVSANQAVIAWAAAQTFLASTDTMNFVVINQ